ncbi:MAG: protein translocase subunit SecD [Candidatus Buchananbacteria bacterium]
MAEKFKKQVINPRKKLRWAIWGIVILFVVTLFIDVVGSKNVIADTLDRGISAVPVLNSFKIWPTTEKNPLDGSNQLSFKNIKEIDLKSYGPYFHLGLDLLGGSHLVYNADMSQIPQADRADSISGVRDVIERRVNSMGISEPLVQTNQVGNDWRVVVELAGVYDINQAIKMIGETPRLEFKTENPNASTSLTVDQQKQIDALNKTAEEKATSILNQVKGGADMAALAKADSEDPGSKDNGGLYTGVKKGTFVPEFNDVIFNASLKTGDVYPQLVKTQFGYHIIKIDARRGTGDSEEVDVRQILIKTKTAEDIGVALQPEWVLSKLTGKNLKKASLEMDQNTGVPQVALEFDSEGAKLFGEITQQNAGKLVAIFLDGQAISIPRVNEPILTGKAVISGNFSLEEAKLLSQRLNAGALPVPINLISQTTVGASLGNESVQKSLFAGFVGLLLVALFMILYYRLPGVLSVIALLIYTTISIAVFKLVPVTMTLAGIAGFILSIGMAVDANVLIFARLKEELKSGKDLPLAIREGFHRAWTSIRDSNISSLITCVILYWFGTSIIKGFALTLAIGIIISMFSAITITRQLLRLVAGWKPLSNKWLYGGSSPKETIETKE